MWAWLLLVGIPGSGGSRDPSITDPEGPGNKAGGETSPWWLARVLTVRGTLVEKKGQACSSSGVFSGWTDQAGGSSVPASSSRSASSAVSWILPGAWWTGA